MLKKYILLCLSFITVLSAYAAGGDSRYRIALVNLTFEKLNLSVSNVFCNYKNQMQNLYFGGKILPPNSEMIGWFEEAGCKAGDYLRFDLSAFGFKSATDPLAAPITTLITSLNVADNVPCNGFNQPAVSPLYQGIYRVTATCTPDPGLPRRGLIQLIFEYVSQPTFTVNVVNKSGKDLMLPVGSFYFFPEYKVYYNPLPLPSISASLPKYTYNYYPYNRSSDLKHRENLTARIAYGFSDSTYCLMHYKWNVDNSILDATAVPANGDSTTKITCQALPVPTENLLSQEVNLVISSGEFVPRENKVTIKNNSDYLLTQDSYIPADDGAHHKYSKIPASTISAGGTEDYTFTQDDGGDAEITYYINKGLSCRLIYNNLNYQGIEPCKVDMKPAANNDPVRNIACNVTAYPSGSNPPVCNINAGIGLGAYKQRDITVKVKNFSLNGQYPKIELASVSPDINNYPEPPVSFTDDESNFTYRLPPGDLPGAEGSVTYKYVPAGEKKPNENYSTCTIKYKWGFVLDASEGSGCSVDVSYATYGHPVESMTCSKSEAPFINGQQCQIGINLNSHHNVPGVFSVSVRNGTSKTANLAGYQPDNKQEYKSLPPSTLASFSKGSFDFNANYILPSVRPKVEYVLADNPTRGCVFEYYWDPVANACAQNTYPLSTSDPWIDCYGKAGYSEAEQICHYNFSIGTPLN